MVSFSSLFYSAAALAVTANAYLNPETCTGNCTGWIHDPSLVVRSDGTWFRFATLGNIAISSAPALEGPWTYLGSMLPQGSSIDVVAGQGLWAPDVSLIGDTYYAYYAVSTSGSQASQIGVATSTTLEPGSWTDHGSIGIPKNSDYNLIDPNFFRACDTCQNYFSFGSAWDDVYQTELSSDFLTWNSASTPYQIAFNTTSYFDEGSFQFWWPVDGVDYYYLFFSQGACCNTPPNLAPAGDEYKIWVCRATSPTGPFVGPAGKACTDDGGSLVLASHDNVYAPGGQGVIVDPTSGKIAMYYHYVDTTIGYAFNEFQFGFNYLDFSSGWPVLTS